MTTNHEIKFSGKRIEFRLQRSGRRTLAITVRPDLAVVVTAPQGASLETVTAKVRKRANWIRRQQDFFADFLPQNPPRRYVSGETHRYLGRQYRLKVVEAATAEVKLRGRFIWVHTPRKADTARVRKLVEGWYLAHARERLARSVREGAARLGRRLTQIPRMQIRRMPKRWGSWTRRGGIWLNPELVKAPASCIDYVVVHELCHAVHGNHGRAFYDLLRRVMPDWETRKARLERS
ncbi:MAG: SprT family zinc-dependent metalloprotease [Verrucomicrobiales bacterium]|nr:SprT family zinc-dependent metalloprotease [Verrucomicrobiales bacterium]